MNASGRKQIAEFIERITKAQEEITEIKDAITELRDDEESKFDNMSEGLQQGSTGQAIEQAKDSLSTAVDAAEAAESSLGEALDALNEIE